MPKFNHWAEASTSQPGCGSAQEVAGEHARDTGISFVRCARGGAGKAVNDAGQSAKPWNVGLD